MKYVRLLDPEHRQAGEDRALTAIDAVADLSHLEWSPDAKVMLKEIQNRLIHLYGAALRADDAEIRRVG